MINSLTPNVEQPKCIGPAVTCDSRAGRAVYDFSEDSLFGDIGFSLVQQGCSLKGMRNHNTTIIHLWKVFYKLKRNIIFLHKSECESAEPLRIIDSKYIDRSSTFFRQKDMTRQTRWQQILQNTMYLFRRLQYSHKFRAELPGAQPTALWMSLKRLDCRDSHIFLQFHRAPP